MSSVISELENSGHEVDSQLSSALMRHKEMI